MNVRSLHIALDAMGGDHAPREPVLAAAKISYETDLHISLVGDPSRIRAELQRVEYRARQLEIVPAREVIEGHDKPREALDAKPDASILVAARRLGAQKVDALVSAGSTGALVLAASREIPMIPGVKRAALAAVYPTGPRRGNPDRFALLLDVGATVRCRATDLLFFAYMGHAYASRISKVVRPSIGLLNMGTEATKGDDVLRAAHRLMQEDELLNFIGNVEGNGIPGGAADVIVCEGLIGNVSLKMAEGVNDVLKTMGRWAFKRKLSWRLGLMLLGGGLRHLKDITDYGEYGGAPLLGFCAPIIKAHGCSRAPAIANAVKIAAKAARDDVCGQIQHAVAQFEARDQGRARPSDR